MPPLSFSVSPISNATCATTGAVATSTNASIAANIIHFFKSFYLLPRAVGRVEGPPKLEAILRGGLPQVLFSAHDLAGALAESESGVHPIAVSPGGEAQREQAVRLAVNIAMFVLCSNYKDDQVHAEHIMKRRNMRDSR